MTTQKRSWISVLKISQAVAIADKEDTYQKIEDDLTVNGIFSGSAVRLSIDENSSIVLPAGGDFSDVTSTLNYQLESGAPESAVARIDYQYGDQTVGHAYLKASVLQGYVPETGTISGNSSGNPAENSSGDPSSSLSSDGKPPPDPLTALKMKKSLTAPAP